MEPKISNSSPNKLPKLEVKLSPCDNGYPIELHSNPLPKKLTINSVIVNVI